MRDIKDITLMWGVDIKEGIGNQYGYYIHNKKLREAVGKKVKLQHNAGTRITDVVFITSPEYFKNKIEDVNTWLFTMFEGTTIPDVYYKQMNKADYLLAPSNWVKSIFNKYFPDEKTFVVNHGVDKEFRYKKRKLPVHRPFRFLWVGAPNPRKGYEEVIAVWQKVFRKIRQVELYVKTTLVNRIERKGNVILDGRKISETALIKLYHSAHCFLFPTRGEGFGLTLAEAMRTGLPCIATNYSGHLDFFDDTVGYPIDYKIGEGKVTFIGENREERTEIAYPDPIQLAETMMDVINNYREALSIGKKANERMKNFTWFKSAKTLLNHIQGVGENNGSRL
jgi:glycosyltransferase involved in cell wall biosynthesis